MKTTPFRFVFAAATLLTASSAFAATYDFESGVQGWYRYGNATALTTGSDTTINTGNALQAPSNNQTGPVVNFSSITLNDGDSLSISFDFHFLTAPTATGNGLRFGFGNQGTVGSTTSAATDTFFYSQIGVGGTTSNPFGFNNATDGGIFGFATNGGTTAGSTALGINDTNTHNLTFTVTRVGTGYDLIAKVDGTTNSKSGWATATVANMPSFNLFGIAEVSASQPAFNMDNVVLNYTAVPEPSTYGLIGAGALAAVAFVRRRRKQIDAA